MNIVDAAVLAGVAMQSYDFVRDRYTEWKEAQPSPETPNQTRQSEACEQEMGAGVDTAIGTGGPKPGEGMKEAGPSDQLSGDDPDITPSVVPPQEGLGDGVDSALAERSTDSSPVNVEGKGIAL